MCHEILTGSIPNDDLNGPDEIKERLLKEGAPKFTEKEAAKFSPELKDFIKCCLTLDPSKRATTNELRLHQFLHGAFNMKQKYIEGLVQMKAEKK